MGWNPQGDELVGRTPGRPAQSVQSLPRFDNEGQPSAEVLLDHGYNRAFVASDVDCTAKRMILEGIVTTLDDDGHVNIAPMGPRVDETFERFVLRPFQTATTFHNLKRRGEGVLHITDDVWLLAQAAIGPVEPPPAMLPAERVDGRILADACRWFEFRVARLDDREQRTTIDCDVVHSGRLRDFFGFNRAKHAVVEAAILATRIELLPIAEILAEFVKLSTVVQKTGGPVEHRAFRLLLEHVNRAAARQGHAPLAIA